MCDCGHHFSVFKHKPSFDTEGRSYKLKHFHIVEYENFKSIAMCWEGSEVLPIEDFKNVISPPINAAVVEASCITLHKPKIAAVFKLETFFKCLRCGFRTEPAERNEVRCCNQDCGILNNSTFSNKFSSMEILVVEGHNKIQLTAFGEMIDELLGDSRLTPTEEALIRSPPILELKYQNNEIVQVVHQ